MKNCLYAQIKLKKKTRIPVFLRLSSVTNSSQTSVIEWAETEWSLKQQIFC